MEEYYGGKKYIKFSFLVNGSLNFYSYHIYIYDSHGKFICCKKSEQDDVIYFDPPYCGVYHIKVIAVDIIPRIIYYSTFYYSGYYYNVLIILNSLSKKNLLKLLFKLVTNIIVGYQLRKERYRYG